MDRVWKNQLQPSLYDASIRTCMQKCNFPPIKIWNKQIKLVCHASTSNKHTNMPYRGKWENQDVSCFHVRVYTYTYRYAYEHMEIYIYTHMFIHVSVCLCTYLDVSKHFQSPEPWANCWLRCPRAAGSFRGRRSRPVSCVAEPAAGGGPGKGVSVAQQLLGTGVGGCSKSCANSSLGIPGWAGRSGKELSFLPKVEATREGANWNTGKSELTTKSKSFSVVEWKDRETHSGGHTERMMGLARCGRKMVLPGMVYMSQTRIIEVLQCRKDEADELMLVEITVLLPIFPSSLISFH